MKASENRKGVRTVKQLERNGGRKQGSQEGLSFDQEYQERTKKGRGRGRCEGGEGVVNQKGS